jgi:hypothetical protein
VGQSIFAPYNASERPFVITMDPERQRKRPGINVKRLLFCPSFQAHRPALIRRALLSAYASPLGRDDKENLK